MGATEDAGNGSDTAGQDVATGDDPPVETQLEVLGRFIKERRERAELSMRELAKRADISNPYLSQIERGLHEPSVRVINSIANALNESAEALLRNAGMLGEPPTPDDSADVVEAIHNDDRLNADQRAALLTVYESYLDQNAE